MELGNRKPRGNDFDGRVTHCFLLCCFKRGFTVISQNQELFSCQILTSQASISIVQTL